MRVRRSEIQVLAGIAGAGRMTSPAGTMISARMKRVQGYSLSVRECPEWFGG